MNKLIFKPFSKVLPGLRLYGGAYYHYLNKFGAVQQARGERQTENMSIMNK